MSKNFRFREGLTKSYEDRLSIGKGELNFSEASAFALLQEAESAGLSPSQAQAAVRQLYIRVTQARVDRIAAHVVDIGKSASPVALAPLRNELVRLGGLVTRAQWKPMTPEVLELATSHSRSERDLKALVRARNIPFNERKQRAGALKAALSSSAPVLNQHDLSSLAKRADLGGSIVELAKVQVAAGEIHGLEAFRKAVEIARGKGSKLHLDAVKTLLSVGEKAGSLLKVGAIHPAVIKARTVLTAASVMARAGGAVRRATQERQAGGARV